VGKAAESSAALVTASRAAIAIDREAATAIDNVAVRNAATAGKAPVSGQAAGKAGREGHREDGAAGHSVAIHARLEGETVGNLDHRKVIAIDGPAAAGKSTVARELADALGILLFDTGSLYRAVTYAALRSSTDLSDADALENLATSCAIELRPATVEDGRLADVVLDGEDVTWDIRSPEVDANVSRVAAYPQVRTALLDVQRKIADGNKVVMVGRDIGTVVTPEAGTKIYLDATVEERARRRYHDIRKLGEDMDYASVLDDLRERDYKDSTRATAPLKAADDAIRIKTDGLSVDDIVLHIERIARERWNEAP
jgi:cytidylate kinase